MKENPAEPDSLTILMVTAWSPSEEAGGVSTVIRTLAAGLSSRHSIQVLVNDWHAKQPSVTEEAGIRCHRLWLRTPYDPRNVLPGLVSWILKAPRILLQLKRLVRSEGIDVVHLHFASAYQFYFRILRALGGPPYIVTLHRGETVNLPKWPWIDRFLTRWTVRGGPTVNAVSDWLRDLACDVFPGLGGIRCIYNGVDLDEIAGFVAEGPIRNPSFEVPRSYCIFVGNVTSYKAPDVAVRAWSALGDRLPDLHLLIVGEPRDGWAACQELIAELGCRERVHMVGALPRADVIRLMAGATALVAPSRNEGFGLMIVEAGAVGLPVVCTRIGPFLEIVEDDGALTVPPEDATALADAVVQVAQDVDLRRRLGQALKQKVEARFSAARMAEAYEAAYLAALGKGSR
jgi:glycosyltransferase involved in cell wall biosynthesis